MLSLNLTATLAIRGGPFAFALCNPSYMTQTAPAWHSQQYKRYLSEAQSRGEEGVVMLSFGVDQIVLPRQRLGNAGPDRRSI